MSNKNDYKQEKVYQENLKAIEKYRLAEIRCNKIMLGFVLLSLIGIGTSIPFIVKSGDIIHEYQNNDNEYASIIDEQTEGVHQKYLNGEIDEITLENELDKINSFDNAKAILKDSSCPLKFQYSNYQNVSWGMIGLTITGIVGAFTVGLISDKKHSKPRMISESVIDYLDRSHKYDDYNWATKEYEAADKE